MNNKTITKWFSALLLMVFGVSSAFAQHITVDNIEINADETKTIAIRLATSDASVLGFQTDIVLPEGFEIGEPIAPEGVIVNAEGESVEPSITMNKIGENTYRLIVFSDELIPFAADVDNVIEFDLTSPANFAAVANLGLTNIRVTNLNADNSMKEVKLADQDVFVSTFSFATGKYLIKNIETGAYWGVGNSWGTQATLDPTAYFETLINNGDGTYKLETQVEYNGGHFFEGDYMDNGNAKILNIKRFFDENDEPYFTIGSDAGLYGYDGANTLMGKGLQDGDKNAFWQFISIEGADSAAYLATATATEPVDATWAIQDAGFGRNNRYQGMWKGDSFSTGGDVVNFNAEKWGGNSQEFDIYQDLDLPNGIYRLTAQGYYRYNNTTDNTNQIAIDTHADGTEEINSYFYANDEIVPFPSIADDEASAALEGALPFSQTDASKAFAKGLYQMQDILVQVTDNKLRIGFTKKVHPGCDWTVWDNVGLAYYGDVTMAEVLFGDKAKEVNALVAEALELLANDLLTDEEAAVEKAALQEAVKNSRNLPADEDAYDAAIAELTAAIEAGKAVINSNVDLAKDAKKAEFDALSPIGDGLFQYSQAAIDAAKAAVDKCTTFEEVDAVAAPEVNAPKANTPYSFTLTTSEGTFYMNTVDGIKIGAQPEEIYFVAQEDGTYALSNGAEYVNYEGSNNWTMTASADAYGWTIASVDGGYTIQGKNGLLGTNTSDGNGVDSPLYGDKKTSNGNCIWQIEVSGPVTVLAEEAVLENWTREFTGDGQDGSFVLNTWSVEDDASGIKTPFIETWVWGGNGAQLSNEKIYRTIENLKPGAYQVNLLLRAYNEMAGSSAPSGVKISANDASVDIAEGQEFSYNNMAGIYDNFTIDTTVGEDGKLDIAVEVYDSNVSWIAFKNLEVIYLGSEAPAKQDKWFTDGGITFKVNDYPDAVNKNAVADARWDDAQGCIVVTSNDNPANDYDAQLFIVLPVKLIEGDALELTMKVKADRAQNGCGTQAHNTPGDYNHWQCVNSINFTTEWVDYESSITVSAAQAKGNDGNGNKDGMSTIAINLADVNGTKTSNNFYFDDIVVKYTSAVGIADVKTASDNNVKKVFRNGQIVILKGGKEFNVAGQRVK